MAGDDLTRAESGELLSVLIDDDITDAQIAALLTAFAIKGETHEELVGLAHEMRARSTRVQSSSDILIDTAGTGSSAVKTFNISTTAAFVIAGAGVPVAKHGARAATSAAGSADVLAALGVRIDHAPENAALCLREVGLCFMFAPLYHSATARVARVRRELGIRTIFNLLGPLTNPAGAQFQLVGVYRADLVERLARALAALGSRRAWVVHGADGLDEITTSGATHVAEVSNADVQFKEVAPEDFECERAPLVENLRGEDAKTNARTIMAVLDGERRDAARTIVVINAAAAIYLCGRADTLPLAAQMAAASIDRGDARRVLSRLIEATNG